MAKKKKYKKYDSFSEFAPGGNAVAEWEAGRRNAQTRGHTQVGDGARFNTPLQEERYKPIEKSTYQSYLARQFSNNPNKISVSSSAFNNYGTAKAALDTIKPGLSKGLMSESAYSNQYQIDVDKAYRLKYMQDDLVKLDPTEIEKSVANSFSDTKAIKSAKQYHKTAADLLKKAEDYKKLYGDNKEVDVIYNAAKTYNDYLDNSNYNKDAKLAKDNELKKNSPTDYAVKAADDKVKSIETKISESMQKGNFNTAELRGQLEQAEIEREQARENKKASDIKKRGFSNIYKDYLNNKNAIEGLEKEKTTPYQNSLVPFDEWYADKKKNDPDSLPKDSSATQQMWEDEMNQRGGRNNRDIDEEIANRKNEMKALSGSISKHLEKKAKITDVEKEVWTKGSADDVYEISENKGTKNYTVDKEELVKRLRKRGLSKKEANTLIEIYKEDNKANEEQADFLRGYEEGGGKVKKSPDALDIINDPVKEFADEVANDIIRKPISAISEVLTGKDIADKAWGGDFSKYMEGREQGRKDSSPEAVNFLYDVGKTAAEIGALSATGGAGVTAVSFGGGAADTAYNKAKDLGASEQQAREYGLATGIATLGTMFLAGKIVGKGIEHAPDVLKGDLEKEISKAVVKAADNPAALKLPSASGAALKTIASGASRGSLTFGTMNGLNAAVDVLAQQGLLRKNSQYSQEYQDMLKKGYSKEEANKEMIKTLTNNILGSIGEGLATGAIIGGGGSAVSALANHGAYKSAINNVETLAKEAAQATDKTSPYFENVNTPEELQRQYRQQAKKLHSDEGGSDEAFRSLSAEKERLQGILTEDYSLDAQKAIDNWENFVNKSRDILGLERELTTKEKQQWKDEFANVRDNLLETKLKVEGTRAQTPEEAVEIQDVAQTIDNEIAKADNVLADLNEPISLPEELPTVKEVNIDNLSDRQAEVANRGAEYNLPEKAVKSMLANDSENISPEEYAIGFNKFYIMGKDSGTETISDAIAKLPELRDTANRITPQAAGVAFAEGKSAVKLKNIDTILKSKPSGKFVAETPARNMNEKYVHSIIELCAKVSGANIALVKDMTTLDVPQNTQGVSFTDTGNIAVQEDIANILGVIIHEEYHLGKKMNTEGAKVFEEVIKDIARNDLGIRGFDEIVKDVITEHGKAGQKLSYEEGQEEAVAYLAETMLLNPDVRDKVIKGVTESGASEAQKKHIIQTILDWIRNAIKAINERVKNARVRKGTESVLKEDLVDSDKAAKAVIDMLKDTKKAFENAKVSETREDTAKYSIIDKKEVTEKVIRNNFETVSKMKAVKKINSDVLKDFDGRLLTQIEKYFNSFDNKTFNNEYGDFVLKNTSAKNIVFHNFNELKGYSLGAIREVLNNGKALYYKTNYNNKLGKDRMLIVAPITIDAKKYEGDYMMGVSIDVTSSSNSVELVEVALEKGEPTNGFDTEVSPSVNNGSPSVLSILKQVIDVKNGKLKLDDVTAIGIDSFSRDSKGRELTEQQQEYFKDSKVRDENGNLLVMYHGTSKPGFNVFDIKKASPYGMHGSGFYFTTDSQHAKEYGRGAYKVYLNVINPITSLDKTHNITKEQLTNYITAIANNEDYGIDNYGQNATIDSVVNDVWNNGKADDYRMINDLNATCIGDFVKAVKLFNEVNNTNYDGIRGDSETIVWNPNQIKNIDNTSPTENEDIRYSLAPEVQNEIDKFEEVKEDIGRQFKILPGSKLDNKQTRQLALETKKKLDSDIDTYELSYQLKALGALIESKNGNIDNTDVQDKAKQIIRDTMKNTKYVNDETQDVLRYIRGTKLQATDQVKSDIPDYNEFRKANFGSINLTNDGAPIDTWIVEAAGIHPYPFSEWVELAPSDIVQELSDWVASAKEGNYTMYDMGGEDAVDFYALELLNDYADAKVEDITNSKAKQRELYENIDRLVGFAKEQTKEVAKAKEDTVYQVNKVIENYKKNSGEIKLKLDEQKRELQDKFSKAMEEEIAKVKGEASEKQKKTIARIKANQKARNRKLKEQSERTHERQQIRKSRDRLYKVITNPKTHKYMDVELKKPVEDLIKAIDLGEQYTIQRLNTMRDNAYIRYTGEELQDKLKKIDETEFKFNNTYNSVLDALKQRVADSVDDSSTYYAPVISLMENAIEKAQGVSLMKMDMDQLKAVKNSLRALEKAVIERNRPVTIKLKNNNKPVETYEEAAKLATNQLESTDLSKFMKAISSHFTGRNIFLAMGGGNPNSIAAQFGKKFDDAYLKEAEIQKTLHDIIDPVMNEKAGKTRFTTKAEQLQGYKSKDLMDVGLKDKYGKPILINKANAIDLYLDLLDSDHLRHIARGGTTIPDYKKQYTNRSMKEVYGNGSSRTGNVDAEITDIENQIKRAYEGEDYDTIRELVDNKATIIKARENDLKKIRDNIKNSLTDYDKKVIKAYRDIVKETTKLANEEWLHTFGFENFTEDDNTYKHIMSDPNFVKGNDSGNKQELITNLSESGITQARVEGAGNPVLSGDIFFNIEDYINTMAKTIAYAGLQRDLNAVMKYKLPGYENVQSSLQHKYPKIAEELHTLQQDLFGGRSHSDGKGKRVISTLRGLSVRSVLSPNLRVALAQIPSYLGTYRYTDGKAIKNAWLPKNRVKQDTIHKYTPLMWVRGAKGFSLETQDLQNANNKLLKTLDKVDRLTNGWIYKIPLKVDAWTVRHTFGAYLDYARRMYPELEEGTKEQIANGESPLYKKAAELFNEGTMRTQPMFNTLNRNAWQRSDNEIAKTLTLFHTQPFQYLNLLIKDSMEYNWAKKNGADTSKVKSAKQKLFKTIAAVTAAQILFNVMKELVDKTIRHKDDSTPEDIAEKIVSSFANMFVLGSTITDGLYDLITKGNINDFEIYGTGTINDIQDFAEQTARAFEGKSVDYKKQTLKILNGLGIPAQNIEKDLGGIWRNIEDFIDNGARDFSNEKTEQELYQDYAKGNYSQEDLKELGYEFGEENKQKIANAIKKVYLEGEIDEAKAVEKLKDTKLFKPTSESEPLTTFLEGKVAMWKINSYKEKYQDSLTDNGAETDKSRKIRQDISKLNWRSAFWSNPANASHKNYKSSAQKLEDMFKKWREK